MSGGGRVPDVSTQLALLVAIADDPGRDMRVRLGAMQRYTRIRLGRLRTPIWAYREVVANYEARPAEHGHPRRHQG